MEKCGFNFHHQQMLQDPIFQQSQQVQEAHYLNYIQGIQPKTVVNIPVVIHVIHTGEAIGTANNPSDAQLLSAIDNLNDAFEGVSPFPNTAPTNIRFCMAQRDPNNNPTTGIVRINGSSITNYAANGCVNNGSSTNNVTQVKASSFWDNTKYYNIWVVTKINGSNGAGTQGYALFPPGGYNASDGTVILANTMGYDPNGAIGYPLKSYTRLNRVLIHEIGHAFSIYHTFEGDNNGASCPTESNCNTQNDRVCDTPPHIQSPTSSCPPDNQSNPCFAGSTRADHVHNFMDYTSESCQYLFTPGQAARINATVVSGGGRYSLTQSNGCQAVFSNDAGIEAIISPEAVFCKGNITPKVTLKNFGTGTITSVTIRYQVDGGAIQNFAWTGSLANNTTQDVVLNPFTVAPGAHSIKVYPHLPNGNPDQNALNDTMTLNFTVQAASLPFVQQFEAGNSFPPANWSVDQSTSSNYFWSHYTGAHANGSSTGIAAIRYTNNVNLSFGKKDMLVTEAINLAGSNAPELSFKIYTRDSGFGPSYYDTLSVYVSTDCGQTFLPAIYMKSGPTLATASNSNSLPGNHYPTSSSQYRTETINLSAYNNESAIFKFERINRGAQNILIDDINIQDPCAAFGDPASISGITTVCQDSNGVVYSIPAVSNATGYTWTVPLGANITAGQNTTQITVKFGTSSGQIKVFATNAQCPNSDTSVLNVTVSPKPSAAGAIVGSNTACQGASQSYSIPSVTNATGYIWTVPTGSTITAGNNTNSITVQFGSQSGNVTVKPTNSCGSGTSSSMAITVNNPPTLSGSISGATTVCPNATAVPYSVSAATGATSYNWTLPPGATFNGASTTNSIQVNFGTNSGNVQVQAQNACGSSNALTLAVSVQNTPAAPDSITGPNSVCANQNGVTYSVQTPVSGSTYNWTIPSGATLVSGAGTATIQVNFGSTSGNISVQAQSTCGVSASTSKPIAMNTAPSAPGAINCSTQVCKNQTGVQASVTPVSGATTYNWSFPTGVTVVSGVGTPTITVNWGTVAGNISVTAQNTCGTSTPTSVPVGVQAVPQTPSISGPNSVCVNSNSVSYTASSDNFANSYNWSVPAGAVINSGQGTSSLDVDFNGNAGNIQVTALNNVCGPSAPAQLAVTMYNQSSPPAGVNGNATVCANSSNNQYAIQNPQSGVTYTWSANNGAIIQSGNGTANVTVQFGSQNSSLSVTANDGCGASTPVSFNVAINAAPTAPTVINTPDTICVNASGVMANVSSNPNATGYYWNLPSGASITNGSNTNQITIQYGTQGGTLQVAAYNSCGSSNYLSKTIFTKTAPNAPTIQTLNDTVCANSGAQNYNVDPVSGATTYVWSVSANGMILSGQNTQNITAQWNNGGGNIQVYASNNCGNSPNATKTIFFSASSTPASAINGPSFICPNATNVVYQVASPTANTQYSWNVPAGASIVSGNGTSQITVNFGANGGTISVVADNGCGASTPTNKNVQLHPSPTAAGAINGPAAVCPNGFGYNYNIAPLNGATSYTWTIPGGATLVSGQGTNSITINMSSNGGSITVTPQFPCGAGASSQLTLVMQSAPTNPTGIAGPAQVCANSTGNLFVSNAQQGVNYNWTVPNGATIQGNANNDSVYVSFGATGGQVSVSFSNACGSSGTFYSPVQVVNDNETLALAGGAAFCPQTPNVNYTVSGISAASSFQWSVPNQSNLTGGQGTSTAQVSFGATSGYVKVVVNNVCGMFSDSVFVVIGQRSTPNSIDDTLIVCEQSAFTINGSNDPPNPYAWTYSWEVASASSGPFSPIVGATSVGYNDMSGLGTLTRYYRRIAKQYGCADTSLLAVVQAFAAPQIPNSGLDSTLCVGDNFQVPLIAISDGSILSWTHDGSGILSNPNSAQPQYQVSAPDANNIVVLTFTVQSDYGCGPNKTGEYLLLVKPVPEWSGISQMEICASGFPVLINGVSANTSNVFWQISGNGVFSNAGSTQPVYTPQSSDAGTTLYATAIAWDSTCYTPLYDTLIFGLVHRAQAFDASLGVNAGNDIDLSIAGEIALQANGNGVVQYFWSPGELFVDSSAAIAVANIQKTQSIVLTGYSSRGCWDRDTLIVSVKPNAEDLFIPSLFSPNADGMNDAWEIPELRDVEGVKVSVFNREGRKVFESDNYQHDWQGTFKGSPLPDASYYYVIEIPGESKVIRGVVSIAKTNY